MVAQMAEPSLRQNKGLNMLRMILLTFLCAGLFFPERNTCASPDQVPRFTLPDDPDKAWAEVTKVHEALRRPDAWAKQSPKPEEVEAFRKQIIQTANSFAGKAREFALRFPSNENVGDARVTVVHALNHAVAAGDPNAEKEIARYVESVLANKSIPEDERVSVLLFSGNVGFMKKAGMRLFTEGMSKFREEMEVALIDASTAALKRFPTNSTLFTMLVAVAERS